MSASEQTLTLLNGLSPRRLAWPLAVLMAVLCVAGLISGSGSMTSFDADLGAPVVVSGSLALVSAWLLWLAGGAAGSPAPARGAWLGLAAVLTLAGVEQVMSLHERATEGMGLFPAVGEAPALALVAVAFLFALGLPRIAERTVLLVALAAWAAAGALDASGHEGSAASLLLVLGASPVMALASLAAVHRYRDDPRGGAVAPTLALRDLLLRVDALRLGVGAAAVLVAILSFAVLFHSGTIGQETFDLRSQQGINGFVSVGLLVAAAGLSLLRGRIAADPWQAWTLLGVVFLAMSFDDLLSLHHELGLATGVPGQFVLFPLVLAAAVGWISCLRLSGGATRALLGAGGALWACSQLIDVLSPEGYFHWWVVPEEACELFGSSLLVVGLLLAVQATASRDGA